MGPGTPPMPQNCRGRRPRVVGASLSVLLAICWAPPVAAVQSATAVGLDLRRQPIRIHRLADDKLRFFDGSRQLRVKPIDQFVQLLIDAPEDQAAAQADRGGAALSLTDGQRLVGTWFGADEDGQTLRLRHPALGPIGVQLERVRRFVPPGHDATANGFASEPAGVDWVQLVNGDVLEGFVASIHTSHVRIELAGGAEPIDVPLERVRSVSLANDEKPELAAVDRLVLRDGSRVHASQLRIESGDQLTFTRVEGNELKSAAVTIDLSRVARIDLGSSGQRLVDLHELPLRVVAGGEVFGVPMPPRVIDGGFWLHAPVTVRFELPAGAVRFAAQADLEAGDGGDRPSSWSDLIVKVAVDGKTEARVHLHAGAPRAALTGAAEGKILTIELEPGTYGPVMDRVLLRQAVVLVTQQP